MARSPRLSVPASLVPLAISASIGASGGMLLAREHDSRKSAERLAAALLETLLNAMDANDPVTGAHVRRVAEYALILADAAGLDEPSQRSVERIALFHDIGKIDHALFDIVHEETRLTPAERRSIARHPALGAGVLAPLAAFYPDLADGVLSHHERWDGKGYPRCLRGRRIPLVARVVAIADTFDALTHARRYRAGRSVRDAVAVIQNGRATQFDPDLVDLFTFPPVLERISEACVDWLAAPPRRAKTRRSRTPRAPDLKFRWRTVTPPPPASDRPR
ncbi:MAG TPA: HD domain-containing phosphohydrolase [Gemmatimonadaceae bacterium]|nr:HD domain-containing phosphohydrolase [Gemmatimonadaceae bacterium]